MPIFQLIPLSDESYYVFLLAQGFVPLVLRSHPLHQNRQFTVVTEFSQWVAAQETADFTLTNPMQDGVMDSAVNVLKEDSNEQIVRGNIQTHYDCKSCPLVFCLYTTAWKH